MTTVLQSFIAGRWIGQQPAQALHSAIHGKEVAFAHAESLDFAEALQYGRTTGLNGMLAMDFQQRAAALRSLAKYLGDRKEELYAISAHTGGVIAAAFRLSVSSIFVSASRICFRVLAVAT